MQEIVVFSSFLILILKIILSKETQTEVHTQIKLVLKFQTKTF